MAEGRRMTAADVVARVMAGEHGDFVRDAVAMIARELMEAEISVEVGAELGEVSGGAGDASQWLSAEGLGDEGRRDRVADPEEASGAGVLPVVSGAAPARRSRRSWRS